MANVAITTSPELIKLLGDKLYDNRLDFILARELLQNSVDASNPEDSIIIETSWQDEYFEISVDDKGIGMTEDILLNVFLNIGGSYKHKSESTGGFGIAKVAIFNAEEWSVHTLDNYIDQNLEFTKVESRIGTLVKARVHVGTTYSWTKSKVDRVIYSNGIGNIIYNGKAVEPYTARGRIQRYSTENGIDYTIRTGKGLQVKSDFTLEEHGRVIFRINGLTQYGYMGSDDLRDAKRNLVIDFGKIGYTPLQKDYPFTMSRESVSYEISQVVNAWLNELAKDTQSKIKNSDKSIEKREWVNPNTGLVSFSNDSTIYKPNLNERRIAKMWSEIVLAVQPDIEWTFGVTNDQSSKAFLRKGGNDTTIVINAECLLDEMYYEIQNQNTQAIVMYMWHMAVHEITHIEHDNHDENFTISENHLALKSAQKIVENSHRLKLIARKLS